MTEQGKQGKGQLGYRLGRLWAAAELRRVPLRTIITAILVVTVFFLAGKVIYRLRTVLLLLLVAGFLALILNPLVGVTQRYLVKRRGYAVTVVGVLMVLVFSGLSVAFGYPLVNGITHLANNLPTYVSQAEHGQYWYGRLVQHYHVQQWVQQNSSKLVTFGQNLSSPALAVGKGALSLVIELLTIFILVLMLLLEGPKLRRGLLSLLSPGQAEEVQAVASEVNRSVVGYMVGNFLTSIICGLVVLVDLAVLGVPFPLLWALWVALVDFLPMIGGALAGIPVVLFALFANGLTAGIITLVVFLVYTQLENHILNPVIMSKTVRISPLLVLVAVLVAASLGDWLGGLFGGFVAALLAIPAAGAFQVIVREAWRLTAPPSEADAEESDIVKSSGDAAKEAREIAQQGVEDDGGDAAQSGEPARHGAHAAQGPS
ncbi:AI-2E family transporter [Trebonia kvetii]|uniref:AI-2E family transporter n=1 Tax=Trebonia kvetii TaxID=2480626 RepID=A0A6P2BQ61_9ACTN|nr:AI-2E family transporter [Trebonia kvetii]TVZ00305.1 AI-2E family transporter [Trebonia kvetii]